MDTQEQPQSTSTVSSSIDLITRVVASALVIVYGLGFVILGFHDARYGVVQFSPFRTRIVLVGFVFTSLVALAAGAQHYGILYIAPLESVRADTEPGRRVQRDTVLAGGFVFTACIMATIFNLFLFSSVHAPTPNKWRSVVWFSLYALVWAVFFLINKIFVRRPFLSVILSVLAFVLFLVSLTETYPSSTWAALAVFFALVAREAMAIKRSESKLKYVSDFTNWIILLLILWIYILQIFSVLPPRWGGGRPTPVLVFQNTPAAGLPMNPVDSLLLDENEQGLYVLLSPTGRAFFIPRGNVATIFFGTKEEFAKR
jgi:hypothetical protein